LSNDGFRPTEALKILIGYILAVRRPSAPNIEGAKSQAYSPSYCRGPGPGFICGSTPVPIRLRYVLQWPDWLKQNASVSEDWLHGSTRSQSRIVYAKQFFFSFSTFVCVFLPFTAQRYAIARYLLSSFVILCPSIRLNVVSRNQRHTILVLWC